MIPFQGQRSKTKDGNWNDKWKLNIDVYPFLDSKPIFNSVQARIQKKFPGGGDQP